DYVGFSEPEHGGKHLGRAHWFGHGHSGRGLSKSIFVPDAPVYRHGIVSREDLWIHPTAGENHAGRPRHYMRGLIAHLFAGGRISGLECRTPETRGGVAP